MTADLEVVGFPPDDSETFRLTDSVSGSWKGPRTGEGMAHLRGHKFGWV